VSGIFKIWSCKVFVWGWLWTTVLLIFASWVARITGVSHWHLAERPYPWTYSCRW
jgi:hypothetical protein